MPQSAARIAFLLLVCAATSPAAAGPHGGGGHGGGGFHFGGGGGGFAAPHFSAPHFSAPSFAPRFSAPHFSIPHAAPRLAVPHISAPRISIPHAAQIARPSVPRLAPQHVAPQRFTQPAQPHLATGSTQALAGAGRHLASPAAQAGRAFALAGAHQRGAGVLHNPFVSRRPALAHATFQGRFTNFWRHHHHRFFPFVVIGWFGPLFWPYAYDDFLDYAFYPYAYDTFWPYAYDDVYAGITGYAGGIGPAWPAAAPRREQPGAGGTLAHICTGDTAGVTDWSIEEIAQAIAPNEEQRAALDELKTATVKALDILKGACPSDLPSTPTGRVEAMHARLSAMLEAVRIVHSPMAKFYGQLTDEQRARFNALPFGERQDEATQRRELTQLCTARAAGIASLPLDRMERAVQPDAAQRVALDNLRDAVAQAGELLKTDCPTYRPLTPVVRLDAMEQRLDAMLRAINLVQPALEKFYAALTDEQKERFNQLQPGQS